MGNLFLFRSLSAMWFPAYEQVPSYNEHPPVPEPEPETGAATEATVTASPVPAIDPKIPQPEDNPPTVPAPSSSVPDRMEGIESPASPVPAEAPPVQTGAASEPTPDVREDPAADQVIEHTESASAPVTPRAPIMRIAAGEKTKHIYTMAVLRTIRSCQPAKFALAQCSDVFRKQFKREFENHVVAQVKNIAHEFEKVALTSATHMNYLTEWHDTDDEQTNMLHMFIFKFLLRHEHQFSIRVGQAVRTVANLLRVSHPEYYERCQLGYLWHDSGLAVNV